MAWILKVYLCFNSLPVSYMGLLLAFENMDIADCIPSECTNPLLPPRKKPKASLRIHSQDSCRVHFEARRTSSTHFQLPKVPDSSLNSMNHRQPEGYFHPDRQRFSRSWMRRQSQASPSSAKTLANGTKGRFHWLFNYHLVTIKILSNTFMKSFNKY